MLHGRLLESLVRLPGQKKGAVWQVPALARLIFAQATRRARLAAGDDGPLRHSRHRPRLQHNASSCTSFSTRITSNPRDTSSSQLAVAQHVQAPVARRSSVLLRGLHPPGLAAARRPADTRPPAFVCTEDALHAPASRPISDDESSDESSEYETEDSEGEELTPVMDAAILRTLGRIRRGEGVELGRNVFEGASSCFTSWTCSGGRA